MSTGHEGHAHAAAADPASEPFPREDLARMVAEQERSAVSRARLQMLVIAIAATFFALAFPTEALLGEGPELVEATRHGAWFAVHILLVPLARMVALLPGLGLEPAWFVVSAVAFGGALFALARSLERAGFSPRVALLAAVTAAAAPAAWIAGTLPGPAAPGLFGASLLLGEVLAGRHRADRKGDLRVAAAFALGLLLDVHIALLAPALVWAAASQCPANERRAGRAIDRALCLLGALLAVAALLVVLPWLAPTAPAGGAFATHALGVVAGLGPSSVGALWLLAFGAGSAVLGLGVLLLPPASPEEARPPAWLCAWIGVPLATQFALGRPDFPGVAIALLPPAALGIARWLEDRPRRELLQHVALLLAGQLAFGWGFRTGLASRDQGALFCRAAEARLRDRDIVLSRDPEHLYLLRHRLALETLDLRAPLALAPDEAADWWVETAGRLRQASDSGRRIVIDVPTRIDDYPYRNELQRLRWMANCVDFGP